MHFDSEHGIRDAELGVMGALGQAQRHLDDGVSTDRLLAFAGPDEHDIICAQGERSFEVVPIEGFVEALNNRTHGGIVGSLVCHSGELTDHDVG
jgi:hypothetical protein